MRIMDSDGKNQKVLMEVALYPDWFVPGHGHYIEAKDKLKTTWGNIKQVH